MDNPIYADLHIIDPEVALEVSSHEAIIRQAYKDSENVWTWSVGLTNATGHDVTRYIGKPQELEHCLRIYLWALGNYAEEVRKAFKGHKLTKAQFTAALSFHWNTGAIGSAIWVKKFKAGDISGARKAFMNYSSPTSIIPRRKKERDLFFDGKWTNVGTMTEYTRLTKASTPVWASGKRIQVAKELKYLLSATQEPVKELPKPEPVKPQPSAPIDYVPVVETLPASKPSSFPSWFAVAVASISTVVLAGWNWFTGLPCELVGLFCGS